MSNSTRLHPDTLALHAGYSREVSAGSFAVPIHQTVAYEFDTCDDASQIFSLESPGHVYSRISNPTVGLLELRLSAIDNGIGAVAFSSGLAALTCTILNLAEAGDNIVSSDALFGGTRSLFSNTVSRMGIEVRFVDPSNPSAFDAAADARTRCFVGESLPNPKLIPFPIGEVADIGNEIGVPLIVDNSAAPIVCNPFDHGAAVTVYSATKYIGGHGAALAGIVIDGGKFDWSGNRRRFPTLSTPDPSFGGRVWADSKDAAGPTPFLARLRHVCLRDLGPTLSPLNAFLILQGVQTLPLRMRVHCENALVVSRVLSTHPKVRGLVYPGLFDSAIERALAKRYLNGGCGALLQFEVSGGMRSAKRLIDQFRIIRCVANIGDARSLAIHPASTTHSQLSAEAQRAAGVTENTIRLSVGLEHVDDIVDDLMQGLSSI